MEQMYLIEIFVDKVTIFTTEEDESSANKNLIIKIRFGPKTQFIIKEGQLAVNEEKPDDIVECDENGRRQWTRTIRVGKSYLFPSYPDTILNILSTFPLEIEVWNDDENEVEIFVGVGNMHWDTQFYYMLKESAEACKIHEPLSIKSKTPLMAECCCRQAGEIYFILRLTALGDSIITEFQQLMKDPESFVFRTNKAPSMFQCKRVEGDDPNFCMVGSLYETTTLEDPDILDNAQKKIEICTELQSCGLGHSSGPLACEHHSDKSDKPRKKYPNQKIRIGDITGPCGNANCLLAHKVRTYIRHLDSYKGKAAAAGISDLSPTETSRKVCGSCVCKDERWHRDECPDEKPPKVKCVGCGGMTKAGDTCEDRKAKHYNTGATPKTSDTQVNYVFSNEKVSHFRQAMYGRDYIVEDCFSTSYNSPISNKPSTSQNTGRLHNVGCCCRRVEINDIVSKPPESKITMFSAGTSNPMVCHMENNATRINSTMHNISTYNVSPYHSSEHHSERKQSKHKIQVYNCTEIPEEKDCRCSPIKPSPPCRTFDCDCMTETANIVARKTHRPYCPSYKHKVNCPVTMMHEEEEQKKLEDEEDESTPLPYGLPPIQLGPCPIMGRPCTVPDGFSRMYKNAQLPQQPPSYSDAGKVCCSKEYHRIKKAIKEYMKYGKDNDFRCVNKFNVDTERRCCDKEQHLLSLLGKSCCGAHKMSIREKFGNQCSSDKQ